MDSLIVIAHVLRDMNTIDEHSEKKIGREEIKFSSNQSNGSLTLIKPKEGNLKKKRGKNKIYILCHTTLR